MVAAVAGEGEEVDLVAVADAAVLPQVGELRRAHPAEPRCARPHSGRAEEDRLRASASPARPQVASRCRHRRSGRQGGGKGRGLGRQTDGTRNQHNKLTRGVVFFKRPSDLFEFGSRPSSASVLVGPGLVVNSHKPSPLFFFSEQVRP